MEIIREIIGAVAIATSVLIYQQKDRRRLLLCKGVTDVLWIGHYLMLGGYTGAAVTGISLVRGIVLYNAKTKNRFILLCFMAASVICTAITWNDAYSLFPAAASLTSVFSFWLGIPKISRIMSFPISACMLTYGVHNGSVTVMINEILVMLSSALGLLFVDRNRKATEKCPEDGVT